MSDGTAESAIDTRPCTGCQGRDSRTIGEIRGFRMQVCRRCKTLFTAHLPGPSDSTDYGSYYHEANLDVPAVVHRQLARLVAGFDRYRRLNRWLDVGCGAGTLLDAAGSDGWETVGTEIADRAAEAARARGLDVRSGELDELRIRRGSFDV